MQNKIYKGNPYKHGVSVPIDPESAYLLARYRHEIGRGYDFGKWLRLNSGYCYAIKTLKWGTLRAGTMYIGRVNLQK